MRCPQCGGSSLHGQAARQNVLVEVCSTCQGLWLDRGQIYEFTPNPQALEKQLDHGLRDRHPSDHLCPRCEGNLERGLLPDRDSTVEQCPSCGGLWFAADELQRALQAGPQTGTEKGSDPLNARGQTPFLSPFAAEEAPPEPEAETDPHAQARAQERIHGLATGLLALPNLFLRSAFVLFLLYGMLGLVLITLVQFSVMGPTVALAIGVTFALLQFLLGPWIMDLVLRFLYDFRWVRPDELPDHLRSFVARVCEEHRMRFPSFGMIHDGAPAAFTYGHHPSNARVVISRGLLQLLEPDEVEAVVGHELGHARNWDMALMTLANLVPLLLYYLYRVAIDYGADRKGNDKKDTGWTWAVAIGAYVLYIISEYIVLWFSRTREYYADRFAGRVTGHPNALASALIKIAYGLAAQGASNPEAESKTTDKKEKRSRVEALGALNIFDQKAAVGLVMASSSGKQSDPRRPDVEQVKGAMQWDMWNPWAKWYELHSTHPLVAKRLLYLSDQAAHQGQEPLVVFDRRKPESYWDDFFVDLFMMLLPWLCFLTGGGVAFAATFSTLLWWKALIVAFGAGLALAGMGSLIKTGFVYRRDFFPHLSVAALLHKVKVSGVRPVPTTLTGTIIGKGVPGLIYSENFVLQDRTGILFLEYNQPLALWNFLFGLFRAGRYQGKQVRVSGWFRRAPVPYMEINQVETLDGSERPRRCWASTARRACGFLMVVIGVIVAVGVMTMK